MSVCPRSIRWLGAERGAGDLVDADRPAGLRLVALDHDHRGAQVLLGAGDLERVVGAADQDDRLDALVAQVADRVDELLAGQALQVGRADEVAGLATGRLDGAVHGARAPEAALGADHADGRRAPGDQRAGGGVGAVAELPDRLQHPLAGLRAQVVLAVDDPRDGLVGDAGEAGDVGHHRRPSAGGRGAVSVTTAAGWRSAGRRRRRAAGAPVMIRIQYELRVPSKEIRVLIMPSTMTPSSEPTTYPRPPVSRVPPMTTAAIASSSVPIGVQAVAGQDVEREEQAAERRRRSR